MALTAAPVGLDRAAGLLVGAGPAGMVDDNLLGAGYVGFTVLAGNHFGLLVSGNNIFPRRESSVHLKNCTNNPITANRLSSTAGLLASSGRSRVRRTGSGLRHDPPSAGSACEGRRCRAPWSV
ncbi:hypothetical protein ACIBL3_19610 [Kribbella sp. NPDC050124]|uniref:hypothetical protein n=1 Tax=Kribbella sp. NPDC050124 TaxID=3364114 RepID=UPI00378E32CF